MAAPFDDRSLIHDCNQIRMFHSTETMGNQNGGAPLHQYVQSLLYPMLGFVIQCRSRFVQQQNRGVFDNRPGDRNSLPLST